MTTISPNKAPVNDAKYCFAIPEFLETERVLIIPFNPEKHADYFVKESLKTPEMFNYLPSGPFTSGEDLVNKLCGKLPPSSNTFFTVFDKTKLNADGSPKLAAVAGLINSSDWDMCLEIGHIMVLPEFHRTHVTTNMVGIFLHYALDLPKDGGLGLRRVVWQANKLNKPSVRTAERMGFQMEGILRWHRMLRPQNAIGSNGLEARKGDPREGWPSRDTAILSLCWDDWEKNGTREKVRKQMDRSK